MRKAFQAASLAVALCGCATGQVNTRIPMSGCEHTTGWSDQVRAAADESWLYAQMAANAYKTAVFDLGPGIVEVDPEARDNDGVGFAYRIYERRSSSGGPSSWVIAYRGTENAPNPLPDWLLGNFLGLQNPRAVAVYQDLRQQVGDAEIVVIGHSLGGGLATHVSLCAEGVRSYVFNSSPRFWRCSDEGVDNVRRSIVEMGEALYVARSPLPEATQRYTAINCVQRGSAVFQHGMPLLARCLTDIAAWNDSTEAKASLQRNGISWPTADEPYIVASRRKACVPRG